MYTCFHSVGLPARPILEAIDRVADTGYAAIELNAETLPWAKAHVTPATPASERRAMVEACARRGLTIPAVGAHVPMVDGDPASRRAAIDFVRGCTDLAADVGSPVVHVLSGPAASEGSRADGWRWFADAISQTTEHAANRGIALAIEAIAGQLFHSVEDYRQLSRDLAGVPFRINFDPSHLEVQGDNPRQVVDEFADRIVHVHMKDGKGRFPNFSFPPLGGGTIDFGDLIRALADQGYKGALSVEYEAQVYGFDETEDVILRHGADFLDRLGVSGRAPL